jgi:multisubunit Na+/H+ antiporter MnhG subunit
MGRKGIPWGLIFLGSLLYTLYSLVKLVILLIAMLVIKLNSKKSIPRVSLKEQIKEEREANKWHEY